MHESRKQVSFNDELLILVNEKDEEIGYKTKSVCHFGEGILHRAFSIFIFNTKEQLLMQKRSSQKNLWPNYWSNSCCSHPRKGEKIESAASRRLAEELGLSYIETSAKTGENINDAFNMLALQLIKKFIVAQGV